jgi:hypothetical protein
MQIYSVLVLEGSYKGQDWHHFGARIGQDKPIDAHAWLDAAGVEVTGYPVANTFAEIACFV